MRAPVSKPSTPRSDSKGRSVDGMCATDGLQPRYTAHGARGTDRAGRKVPASLSEQVQ